jgi:hypothetical protein
MLNKLFHEQYEQHINNYIDNGPKYGGPDHKSMPFMIANGESFGVDYS